MPITKQKVSKIPPKAHYFTLQFSVKINTALFCYADNRFSGAVIKAVKTKPSSKNSISLGWKTFPQNNLKADKLPVN